MSEPTSAQSIEDLMIKVAREAGMAYHGSSGQEKAMIPIDEYDLDLTKRIVRDGIRMFIADAPRTGWRWMHRTLALNVSALNVSGTADAADSTSLTDLTLATPYPDNDDLNTFWIYITGETGEGSYAQITDYVGATGKITVSDWLDQYGNAGGTDPDADSTFKITRYETVAGDIHRYPLPEYFGSQEGQITYANNTNHASVIEWCDEALIRQRRAVTVNLGYPSFAAIRPLEYVAGATIGPKRRQEIIFDPNPSSDDTFEFPYDLYFNEIDIEAGTATGGSTITIVDSALINLFPDDYFNGWVINIVSGTGKNDTAIVTDYTNSTGTFTVADWLFSDGTAASADPTTSSIYIIQPANNLHPAGFRFDEAIESACLAKAEMLVDEMQSGFVAKYQNDLANAKKLDMRSAPRSVGSMNKRDRYDHYLIERVFENRTYNTQ